MSETQEAPDAAGVSSEGLARIDAWLGELIAAGELPGAVILVARGGKVIHRAALGLKDLASGEPVLHDTIFRIFSMTKRSPRRR